MSTTNEIKRYSDFEVLSSQPGIEAAMHLVRLNALESGATADRMFLKVRAGRLAGLDLLWDQPSLSWVEKVGGDKPKRVSDVESIASLQGQVNALRSQLRVAGDLIRALDPSLSLDHVCLCGAPLPSGVEQCEECRKGFVEAVAHTPGPWTVGPHPGNGAGSAWRTILSQGGAFPGAYVGEALERDAHLMAAAPELLESLRNLLGWHEGIGNTGGKFIEGARAAIAKAEGKGGASC